VRPKSREETPKEGGSLNAQTVQGNHVVFDLAGVFLQVSIANRHRREEGEARAS
jgi:hypothetical protein